MKVSEVTPADLAEFLRLDEYQEDEMQRILDTSKRLHPGLYWIDR